MHNMYKIYMKEWGPVPVRTIGDTIDMPNSPEEVKLMMKGFGVNIHESVNRDLEELFRLHDEDVRETEGISFFADPNTVVSIVPYFQPKREDRP